MESVTQAFATAIVAFFGSIILILITGAIASFPVYLCWNYFLVPAVTIVKPVTWLQAWGIFFLSGMLFRPSVKVKSEKN